MIRCARCLQVSPDLNQQKGVDDMQDMMDRLYWMNHHGSGGLLHCMQLFGGKKISLSDPLRQLSSCINPPTSSLHVRLFPFFWVWKQVRMLMHVLARICSQASLQIHNHLVNLCTIYAIHNWFTPIFLGHLFFLQHTLIASLIKNLWLHYAMYWVVFFDVLW